ncbi:hypothetical protein ABZ747_19285, partial [Kitasatospora cineracea]|uniref:hypothetical protein n=1 Tax=Kitasatospora cineracea TaxID=88074 RepID=UPI0033E9615D
GRLAGFPRVGLGPMTENVLGLSLAKEHSAAPGRECLRFAPALAVADASSNRSCNRMVNACTAFGRAN